MSYFTYLTLKNKKFYDGIQVDAGHHECGSGKGGDIWGEDWLIPVAEEFEWHFYDDTTMNKQYITTKLTDYILGFIPFSYDEFVYELPAGTIPKNTLTTKAVVDYIYFLEHWNWHTDEVYYDDRYDRINFTLVKEDKRPSKEYKFGNNDYLYIRTKE